MVRYLLRSEGIIVGRIWVVGVHLLPIKVLRIRRYVDLGLERQTTVVFTIVPSHGDRVYYVDRNCFARYILVDLGRFDEQRHPHSHVHVLSDQNNPTDDTNPIGKIFNDCSNRSILYWNRRIVGSPISWIRLRYIQLPIRTLMFGVIWHWSHCSIYDVCQEKI